MLKNHPKIKGFLRWFVRFTVGFFVYLLVYGAIFGIDAGWRIPDHEKIVQIEMWSSDSEKACIEKRTYTEPHNIEVACALVSLTCDYKVMPPLNLEDIPRFTMVMTLDNGRECEVCVGNTTVAFNGTYKVLRDTDAAKILTEQFLG